MHNGHAATWIPQSRLPGINPVGDSVSLYQVILIGTLVYDKFFSDGDNRLMPQHDVLAASWLSWLGGFLSHMVWWQRHLAGDGWFNLLLGNLYLRRRI